MAAGAIVSERIARTAIRARVAMRSVVIRMAISRFGRIDVGGVRLVE
jgi:hypothetical protein